MAVGSPITGHPNYCQRLAHCVGDSDISNILKTVQSRVFNQLSARTCGRNAIYDDVKMDRRMTNDGLSSLENQQNL